MSDSVVFRELSVEGFRGFRDRQVIPLDASVVVLSGPNGTGKTSVFDALQWALLGALPRLAQLRQRRNDEHIVNHYRRPEPAVVEVSLAIGDREITIRRSGQHDSSLLELTESGQILRASEAERALQTALAPGATSAHFESLLLTSALLQQDVIRSALETKPSDRYTFLNDLLGFGELERFERAVKARLKLIGDSRKTIAADLESQRQERVVITNQLETTKARAATRPAIASALLSFSNVLAQHTDSVRVNEASVGSSAEARAIALECRSLRIQLRELLEEEAQLLAALERSPGDEAGGRTIISLGEQIEALEIERSELAERLGGVETQLLDLESAAQSLERRFQPVAATSSANFSDGVI